MSDPLVDCVCTNDMRCEKTIGLRRKGISNPSGCWDRGILHAWYSFNMTQIHLISHKRSAHGDSSVSSLQEEQYKNPNHSFISVTECLIVAQFVISHSAFPAHFNNQYTLCGNRIDQKYNVFNIAMGEKRWTTLIFNRMLFVLLSLPVQQEVSGDNKNNFSGTKWITQLMNYISQHTFSYKTQFHSANCACLFPCRINFSQTIIYIFLLKASKK